MLKILVQRTVLRRSKEIEYVRVTEELQMNLLWRNKTHQFWFHELFQIGPTQSSVPVVSDVSTVHDLTEEVPQVFPRNFGIVFKIIIEHADADGEITGVEGINSIPPLSSKFSSFRDNSVKIAESKQDGFEFCFFGTRLQSFLIEVVEGFVNVGQHSRRRFICYFNGRLQNSLNLRTYYKRNSRLSIIRTRCT